MARQKLELEYELCHLQNKDISLTEEYWQDVLSSRKKSTSQYTPQLTSNNLKLRSSWHDVLMDRKKSTDLKVPPQQTSNKEDYNVNNNIIAEKARELIGPNALKFFLSSQLSSEMEIIALINNQDIMGRTALHEVCELNVEVNLLLLLRYGADPNITDWRNQTPLHYAVQRGHFNLVRILVDFMHVKSFELIDSSGKDILLLALAYSHIDIAIYLLQFFETQLSHIDLSQILHREDNEGNSAALLLKQSNYFDIFDRVWKKDDATSLIHLHSMLKTMPSLWSVVLHSSSIISPFWLTNFNVFPKIKSHSTKNFDCNILKLLRRFKRGFANEDICLQFLLQQDLLSATPLHYVVKRGFISMLNYILTIAAAYRSKSIPEFPNVVPLFFLLLDYSKRSILHYCAQTGNEEMLTYLLNHLQRHTPPEIYNKVINLRDINGDTPLLIAAQYHHWDLVQVFLQYNAHHSIANESSHNLFSLLVEFDQREKFRRFVELFPDCDLSYALFIACKNGNFDLFHCILARKSKEEVKHMVTQEYYYLNAKDPIFPVQIAMDNLHFTLVIYILEEFYSQSSLNIALSQINVDYDSQSVKHLPRWDPLRERLLSVFERIETIRSTEELEVLFAIFKYNTEAIPLSNSECWKIEGLLTKLLQSEFFQDLDGQSRSTILLRALAVVPPTFFWILKHIFQAMLLLDEEEIQPLHPLFNYLRLDHEDKDYHSLSTWVYLGSPLIPSRPTPSNTPYFGKYIKLLTLLLSTSTLQAPENITYKSFSHKLAKSSSTQTPLIEISKLELEYLAARNYWEVITLVLSHCFHNNFTAFSASFPFYEGFYYAIKHHNVAFIYLYCKEFLLNYNFPESEFRMEEKSPAYFNSLYFKKLFHKFHEQSPAGIEDPQDIFHNPQNTFFTQYRSFQDKHTRSKNFQTVHSYDLSNNGGRRIVNRKKTAVLFRYLQYACLKGNPETIFTLLLFTSQLDYNLIPLSFNCSALCFKATRFALPVRPLPQSQLQLLKSFEDPYVTSFLQSLQSHLLVNHLIYHWRNFLDRFHRDTSGPENTFLNFIISLTDDYDYEFFDFSRISQLKQLQDQHCPPNKSYHLMRLLLSHSQGPNISKGFYSVMNQYYLSPLLSKEYHYLTEKIQFLIPFLTSRSQYYDKKKQIPNLLIQLLLITAKKGDKTLLQSIIQYMKKIDQTFNWERILSYRVSEFVQYQLSYVNLFYYLLYKDHTLLEKDPHSVLECIMKEMQETPSLRNTCSFLCTQSLGDPFLTNYTPADTKAMWATSPHCSILSFAIDQSSSLSFASDASSSFEEFNSSATFIIDDYQSRPEVICKKQSSSNQSNYQLDAIYKILKSVGCKSSQATEDAKIAAKKGYWEIAFDLLKDSPLENLSYRYFISFFIYAIEQKNQVILGKLFDWVQLGRVDKNLLYSLPRSHLIILAMNPSLFTLFLSSPIFDITPVLFISIFLSNHKSSYPHSCNTFEYVFLQGRGEGLDRKKLSRLVDKRGNSLLHIIAKHGNPSIFKAVEPFIQPSDYQAKNDQLHRPIETACRSGNTPIALLLIDRYSIQRDFPTYRDKEGENILHHIFYSGKKKILRKFFDIFYSALYYAQLSNFIGEVNNLEYNCLSYAYAMGHTHMLTYFSSLYADQNFDVIAYGEYFDIFSLLSDVSNLKGYFSYFLKLNQTPPVIQYNPSSQVIDDYQHGEKELLREGITDHKEDFAKIYYDELKNYSRRCFVDSFEYPTAISCNNLNLLKAYRKFGFMLNGPIYFLQACAALNNISFLQYAYSANWFSISDLYYNPHKHPLYNAHNFYKIPKIYSPIYPSNNNCPLFYALIYGHRDVYRYFKELLMKESMLFHPSSIKELRDSDENSLLYWLIRNNWVEDYEEVLLHYHPSDPLDLDRLRFTSKSKGNIYHIVYGTRNHPLQSHLLFQLPQLFPQYLPLFSDCLIFLFILNNYHSAYDVIISTFNINYNYNDDLARKSRNYLIQFLDFLFEFLPLSFIHRSFYALIDNIETVSSLKFHRNRNILHLIISNPTKFETLRYKHYRYFFDTNPDLISQKDDLNATPVRYLKYEHVPIYFHLLQLNFPKVLLTEDFKHATSKNFYYWTSIVPKILITLSNKVRKSEVDSPLGKKFYLPPKIAKLLHSLTPEQVDAILCHYSDAYEWYGITNLI